MYAYINTCIHAYMHTCIGRMATGCVQTAAWVQMLAHAHIDLHNTCIMY